MKVEKPVRQFLPLDFVVTDWANLKPLYDNLKDREISSVSALETWLRDRSELESLLEEDMGWRYIRMTCDTQSAVHAEAFNKFVTEIEPEIAPYADLLNRKFNESPFKDQVKSIDGIEILNRGIESQIRIFREENIKLLTEIQQKQQEFAAISGAMTVDFNGDTLTLQQAAVKLQDPNRKLREQVWKLIQTRRAQDRDRLNDLYTDLIKLRHQVAVNAGFDNFRDYMFVQMGRFDYTPADCKAFHDAVAESVVPLEAEVLNERKTLLQVDALKPWDLAADPLGRPAQRAFDGGQDLLEKTIAVFGKLGNELASYLKTMSAMGHLDLESRIGKAPGGYNYPLDEIGVPFIFMNATSTVRDMVTMLHEGGHAVHSFVTRGLALNTFKHTPSEVAELASMSMELLTLDYWDTFFPDPAECKRAKQEHLTQILETLPWVACIDAFQHWVYENPDHSISEREAAWVGIYSRFSPEVVDWFGFEQNKAYIWQKQLHLYEVPFYYIEYGMAQLGAVAVWRNYKNNPTKAVEMYLNALKLGYTRNISEIYQTAGIKFDFSAAYINELMQFVKQEIAAL